MTTELDEHQAADVCRKIDEWRAEGDDERADRWASRLGCRVRTCSEGPVEGQDYCGPHQERLEYIQEAAA